MVQLEFCYQINTWQLKGVPFKDHLYVPEVHPVTGAGFCEREDDGHVFKVLLFLCFRASHVILLQRIGQSLRQGGPFDIRLERFEEAVHDTSSGLTYSALSGVRKQSVQDVERLFGDSLIQWMEKKGYLVEAKHLRVIRNWRRASDEQGLSDEQRSHFNNELLNYILDELMPWHKNEGSRDFSLIEVNQYARLTLIICMAITMISNRSINNIKGFSRETLVALIANIESREWRRQLCEKNGLPGEHPRASSSDDVECFFSILRDNAGKDFTLKQVCDIKCL